MKEKIGIILSRARVNVLTGGGSTEVAVQTGGYGLAKVALNPETWRCVRRPHQ